jgi:hypothetical protein
LASAADEWVDAIWQEIADSSELAATGYTEIPEEDVD